MVCSAGIVAERIAYGNEAEWAKHDMAYMEQGLILATGAKDAHEEFYTGFPMTRSRPDSRENAAFEKLVDERSKKLDKKTLPGGAFSNEELLCEGAVRRIFDEYQFVRRNDRLAEPD